MKKPLNQKTGVLLKNKMRNSERSPEYYGFIIVEGKRYSLLGWTKTSTRTGDPFIGLAVESENKQLENGKLDE